MSAEIGIHQAAATLTAGVISNLPDDLVIDAEIADNKVRLVNLMTWEVHRIFYHAILGAVNSNESWPSPRELDNSLVNGLTSIVNGLGADDPIRGAFMKLLGSLVKDVAPEVVPNPGNPA